VVEGLEESEEEGGVVVVVEEVDRLMQPVKTDIAESV
jgi:hypothetical protein